MKYYCNNCESFFDEDEMLEDFDEGTGLWWQGCPSCKSGEFDAASKCVVCGETILPEEMFCEECDSIFRAIFNAAVRDVKRQFSPLMDDAEERLLDWIEREKF